MPHRRLGRLQARPRPDLPRLRARALRRLHHRGDLRPAGLPPSRRARRGRASCSTPSRSFPSAPIIVGAYALGKAQRVMALLREAGYDAADLSPRRDGAADRVLQARGHRARRDAEGRPAPSAASSAARSCSARPPRSRTCGRGASPIRSPPSPRAGCGCARAPARRASSCRSSSPTMPTGTISAAPSSRPAPGRSGSRTARRTRSCIGAARSGIAARAAAHAGLWRRGRGARRRRAAERRAGAEAAP